MDRTERLERAIDGRPTDRVPVSAWSHLCSEHLAPDVVAKLHVAYQEAYRWDFVKVMFDYRLDVSNAVDAPAGPDLALMLRSVDWAAPFRRQVEVLRALRAGMSDVPLVETIYSPWMYLVRHLGADLKVRVLEQPDLLDGILERIAEESCRHAQEARNLGCFGVYFATVAAEKGLPPHLRDLQKRFDTHVLGAATGMVRMLHLHGDALDVAAVADYPREVLHWDNSAGNPTLADLRSDNRCLMGGLPPAGLTGLSMTAFRGLISDAMQQAGGSGFILAPGCTVAPSLSARKLRALRDMPSDPRLADVPSDS